VLYKKYLQVYEGTRNIWKYLYIWNISNYRKEWQIFENIGLYKKYLKWENIWINGKYLKWENIWISGKYLKWENIWINGKYVNKWKIFEMENIWNRKIFSNIYMFKKYFKYW